VVGAANVLANHSRVIAPNRPNEFGHGGSGCAVLT
jgi:hypothetical protein